jgi:hypothetical protein
MKLLFSIFALTFSLFLFTNSSCKKNQINKNCACAANEIKYNLLNISGTLAYNQYKEKWALRYQPIPGNYSYYFPCNTSQDSLRSILQGANQSQTFSIKFSGKVKGPCPGEDFGITSGVTTFDYIILDSLKRN